MPRTTLTILMKNITNHFTIKINGILIQGICDKRRLDLKYSTVTALSSYHQLNIFN